jgi:hypothetical protein
MGPLAVLAQVPPPGRAHLFVLDLAGTPVGEFPTAIKQLTGSMEVAIKDGVPMLKASARSEFLITLPQGQVLPADFTLEFDLVPKPCCNPPDLSFEGTPTINQGAGSAHVLWDSDGYLAIIGGGGNDNYEAPMPEDLRATLPGVLTNVVAVVQGPTIRLYTNGRRHYTLDKQFARGNVLRVSLGVDPSRQDPVHLAGLRILAGAFSPTGVAVNPVPPPGQPGANTPGAAPATPVLVGPTTGSITPMPSPPAPAGVGGRTTPPTVDPLSATGPANRNSARCVPGPAPGAPPLNYRVGGGRVGGGVMEWWVEAGAEYLVERAPDPGNGSRSWTRLTSTCDVPSGLNHFMRQHEDGNSYPAMILVDIYTGLQLGLPHFYRVTVIRPDGTAGSSEGSYTPSGGQFIAGPIAAVNGNTVRLAADVSYCAGVTPPLRCDPWMMEFTVTSSTSGFSHSSRQVWVNSYDPNLPFTVPGGIEGTFVFTIPGVPSGTHTFALTALYQPDFRASAGSVTVVVP